MNSNKTWIEISKGALLHNLETFRGLVGKDTKVMCVVKANAYGHGLGEVVGILKGKPDWFGVDSIEEALRVREIDRETPVLVLGYIPEGRLLEAIENSVSITVYSDKMLRYITSLKLKQQAHIHLKVETGLNRQGLHLSELLELVKFIQKNKTHVMLEGLSTHFANIEDTLDPAFAMQQLQSFREAVQKVEKSGVNSPLIHCAASAATLLYRQTHFSMVRIGEALYGAWPSKETRAAMDSRLRGNDKVVDLKPVLTWKSIVAQVKEIETGESVGYGRTWVAGRKTKIAIIPVGYSDGYDRGYSNNSRILIHGAFALVIGRIAMNMFVVDITEIKNVKVEDEVILIGKSGKNEITIDELAQRIGTINYEIDARISPLLPRIVVK